MGVLVGGGEGAEEHKGARTHLLVVSDGREAARGGLATCTAVAAGGCTAPADARLLAMASKRRQRAAGPQRRLGGAVRRKEHGEGTGLRRWCAGGHGWHEAAAAVRAGEKRGPARENRE